VFVFLEPGPIVVCFQISEEVEKLSVESHFLFPLDDGSGNFK